MKVLVINGSPKGEKSITLQTVKYLELKNPDDQFTYLPVGGSDSYREKKLPEVIQAVREHDLVLFSYPVYTFMAPSQLHHLLHLLKGAGVRFEGKYATQLSTSKHFYDVTAHRYIEENCADLGFTVFKGLSADMEDLPTAAGRKQAADFWRFIHWSAEGKPALRVPADRYTVTLVTDAGAEDTSLQSMIRHFVSLFPGRTDIVNLREHPLQGGCMGCLKCAATGKCVYTDHFDSLLKDHIQATDAILYAFTVTDHSMGPLFKQYDDRQFCNGHRTVTMGHPTGYIVSGSLSAEQNLQTILEARAQVGGNHLSHIATDELDPAASVEELCRSLLFALETEYQPPKNFYGVGGMRIFRDLIYQMQGLMRQDHKFFKSHGQYDFPQKKKGTILGMYLVGMLFANPKLMKKMGSKIDEGMLAPYTKVLENAKNETTKDGQ